MVDPKARSRFDFSKLDHPTSMAGMTATTTPKNQINVVLELNLADIEEDPDQPRKEFPPGPLKEFAGDIKKRGVQQPITVRPKGTNGKYRIIHGARRYRGSLLAGKTTIPALIESNEQAFDDYSQVTENTQRENLNALDIAAFIYKRQKAGDSNKVIAEGLSVSASFVARHAALLDAPENLQNAFKAGRIGGVDVFYEMLKLLEENPEAAAGLLLSGEEVITRSMVRAAKTPAVEVPANPLADAQAGGEAAASPVAPQTPAATDAHQDLDNNSNGSSSENLTQTGSDAFQLTHSEPSDLSPSEPVSTETLGTTDAERTGTTDTAETTETKSTPKVVQAPYHKPELDKKEPPVVDPNKIKKPLLLGKHAEREIKLLLQRKPTEVGLIHIQYEDTMEEAEVAISDVSLTALLEMRQQEKG